MDTSLCPEGFFTDEILVFPGNDLPCQADVGLWLGLALTILALRWLLVIPQFLDAKRRWNKKQQASRSPSSLMQRRFLCATRIPVFLLSQVINALASTLLVLLASLNVVNSRNGGSFTLLGIFGGMGALSHFVMARTVIKLGRKIIPLSSKKLTQTSGDNDKFSYLATFDLTLKVLASIGALASVIATLLLIFIPAVAEQRRELAFRVAFAAIALYQAFVGLTVIYQFARCLHAISKMKYGNSQTSDEHEGSKDASNPPVSPSKAMQTSTIKNSSLDRAISTMKIQLYVTVVTVSSMVVISALIANFTIVLHYWVYCILFPLVDVIFLGAIFFAPIISKLGSRKEEPSDAKASSTNDKARLDNQLQTAPGDESFMSLSNNDGTSKLN